MTTVNPTINYTPPVIPTTNKTFDVKENQTDDLTLSVEHIDTILDADWVKQSFLLNSFTFDPAATPSLSDGTERLWLYFDGEPLLTIFWRWLKIGVCGLWGSTPKSLSSKAGMLKVSMEGII